MPSSNPIHTPPLFRKDSASRGVPPSLSRSPSSPAFSPSPSSPLAHGWTGATSKGETQNHYNTHELMRVKSEEEVTELKKKNRRAKIDNFEPIPILHQYSSSPSLTTPSLSDDVEGGQSTPSVRTVELALASFGVSEVEEKLAPWYLHVNSSHNLDSPKVE